MSNVIVIPRENVKAIEALKRLKERKAELRAFLANGGSIKNYKRK